MAYRVLDWVVLALACLPLTYYLFALDTVRRFARRTRDGGGAEAAPPISVLKPVRGLDPGALDQFRTFCAQDYPQFEVLFAVADDADPAAPVIRRLIEDHPNQPIRLIVGAPPIGTNSKVNKLCRLAREARYDLLVVSDSDVAAPRGYLRAVALPFSTPGVGLVTCLYRGTTNHSILGDLEAIGISTEFAPSVLVARRIEGMAFALGATMAVNRNALTAIGGFEALADCCADDYELGRRIREHGYLVQLADCVVSTECAPVNLAAFLRHQLRWAVTIRHSRPSGYLGKVVATQGLPWTLAAAFMAPSAIVGFAYVGAYIGLRLALAVGSARCLESDDVRRRWWLVPLWDAVSCVTSLHALMTNRIEWRGRYFDIRGGKLVPSARA